MSLASEPPRITFDLHVHTAEGSSCAVVPAVEVLKTAHEQGLDGLAFTDHHHLWADQDLDRVKKSAGVDLVLLSGQEITFQGIDFLVFGWDGDPASHPNREAFVRAVIDEGGAVVVAHPFSILYYLDPGIIASWGVDGVEVFNALKGGPTPAERRELETMELAETGGSDFHRHVLEGALGNCWTEIRGKIENVSDLVDAIRQRRTRAVRA